MNALLSNFGDVDEMCEVFTAPFLEIARECIPTKTLTIRNNDKPWFNNKIRKEIRIRDRLRKKKKLINLMENQTSRNIRNSGIKLIT